MIERILVNLLLLLGVFYLPWWIVLGAAVLVGFWFHRYYELIAIGLLVDLLYGQEATRLFPFIVTVSTIAAYGIVAFLKTKLRWYE